MTREDIEKLFRSNYAKMYHLAHTILYDEDESKDAVSEVFANILINRIELLPPTAEAYLLRSVRNTCNNIIKHKEIRGQFFNLQTEVPEARTSNSDEQLQFKEFIRYIRKNMPPFDQQIFRLRYLDGLTCHEVAEKLGVSRMTIHTHLRQIIELIKAFFE